MKKSRNLNTGAMSNAVANHLRTTYSATAVPRLTIDWNWNRYATPTPKNTPLDEDEGAEVEMFPIESIVEPLRPNKGMTKAKINEGVVSAGYLRHDSPKFYTAGKEDVYKYWTSPYPTKADKTFPLHTDGLTTARPQIMYDKVVSANKIVIKIENTWASPSNHTVHIRKRLDSNWVNVAGTNPTIDNDGNLTLWFNGTAWVTSKPETPVATDIAGIQLRVPAMKGGIKRNGQKMSYSRRGERASILTDGKFSSLNVIAIEAHLSEDMTHRLVNVDDTFDMSDKSQLYPIGTITTNVGNLNLSNDDLIFNPENTESPYKDLIEPNCEISMEYIFTIDSVKHAVQQFKMYASNWSGSQDGVVIVSLEDYSKYLKEIKPNAFMIENKTVPEIIWRVLDSVGFVDYEIQQNDLINNHTIPVFWTTGEQTVWEVLDEIAKATQTAIYFDAYGKLQVRSRDSAFDENRTVDWNLLGVKSGTSLPDIVSWAPTYTYEANKIKVTYRTTKWKINSKGYPAMSKVWEPETETVVLRSSPLRVSMDKDSSYIFLDQKDAELWPFEGRVEIDGEIIKYEGKHFIYYTYTEKEDADGVTVYTDPVKNTLIVKNADEHKKYHLSTPKEHRNENKFTGGLKIVKRGAWNSEVRNHDVDLNGWSTKMELNGKSDSPVLKNDVKGFKHNKTESTATLKTPSRMNDKNDTFWAIRGKRADEPASGYKAYGTKFKFNRARDAGSQTIGFCYYLSGSRENGYYIEVKLSSSMNGRRREDSNEVSIYSKKGNKYTLIDKGSATAIGADIWYELDVYHEKSSGNQQPIFVYINGQLVSKGATTADTAHEETGRFGLFARGKTSVDFEYAYGVARPNLAKPNDNYNFYDLKYGGVRGSKWLKEYVWEMDKRIIRRSDKPDKKESYRHNLYLFDEFGPYVREIREYDVKFDPAPVRYSYLFNTNEWFSATLRYNGTPFGSSFVVANLSRDNAVLHGEDRLTFAGASAGINQVMVVLGQNLEIADDETVERRNEQAIRSRGEIESELSSDWIQSKSMAQDICDWMAKHWSNSVDEVQVEIFGNPMIEVGDFVDVNYPREDATPQTHQYFVVGTSSSFSTGIVTSLTLRRKRLYVN